MASGYEMADALRDIKHYRDDKLSAQKRIQELTYELNELYEKTENLIAENRYLRELAEVGDNYGVIEEVKI